jgi:hypothetical protein
MPTGFYSCSSPLLEEKDREGPAQKSIVLKESNAGADTWFITAGYANWLL